MPGSAQGTFLQANLGSSRCTLAYWHEPYYKGSGSQASAYTYFWNTLHAAGADIVLNGHIHTYARFAPQDANGNIDTAARDPRVHRRHGRRGQGIAPGLDQRPVHRKGVRAPRADAAPGELRLEVRLGGRLGARLRLGRLPLSVSRAGWHQTAATHPGAGRSNRPSDTSRPTAAGENGHENHCPSSASGATTAARTPATTSSSTPPPGAGSGNTWSQR